MNMIIATHTNKIVEVSDRADYQIQTSGNTANPTIEIQKYQPDGALGRRITIYQSKNEGDRDLKLRRIKELIATYVNSGQSTFFIDVLNLGSSPNSN